MLSFAVAKLPEGPEWSYEVKFDGYRALFTKVRLHVKAEKPPPPWRPPVLSGRLSAGAPKSYNS